MLTSISEKVQHMLVYILRCSLVFVSE